MPELIIGFAFILILVAVWFYVGRKKHNEFKEKAYAILNTHGIVSDNGKSTFFEFKDKTYEILLYKIAKTHELTINSKYIWEVHMKSRSTLINQMYFLKSELPKIVIIYPMETRIKRFINENEMEFVDYKDEFYNMRLVKLDELDQLFTEVIQ